MKIPSSFIFLFLLFASFANAQKPILPATRITIAPKIDGHLDEEAWKNIPVVNTPITYSPEYGKPASQKTEVRLAYDDVAIYVGVYMYDSLPKQIKKQLGSRDDVGALADVFTVGLGPYNDGLNGYRLSVSAAGVQSDEKGSPSNQHDASWDAVWQSAVSINGDGWVCEMKIPYSAIRFPSKDVQDWGLQFGRSIARNGELDLWSPVDPKISGIITQWGTLANLTNIEPPLRLSFSPYLTAGVQSTPISSDPVEYQTDKILSGGMDVKWGINESFTLDATLIPDFGQVQSDNLVLNISPFETKFDEKRPFFTEGTELFNQDFSGGGGGSQLFYSRRIGGTPIHYYDIYDQVGQNETLIKNPSDTKLYNATKFSGRTDDGLGIGVLNAVSRPAYAEIKNDETGAVRTVETNPVTNYNVFVLDQTLKNNSKISFENMNTMRSGSVPDANVASLHYDIRNKENSLEATGFGNYSAVFDSGFSNSKTGGYYNISLNETKGKWTEWIWHELITPNYDQNDLGILFGNNQMTVGGGFNYNNQELKKGPFYNVNSWGSLNYKTQVEPFQYQEWEFNTGFSGQFKNFYNIGAFIYSKPLWYYDYYEPRVEGAKYYHAPFVYSQLFFNTDYRKKVALSASLGYGESPEPNDPYLEAGLSPYFILNDHFSFWYDLFVSKDRSNYGFVDFDSNDEIIFGRRNTFRVSNTFNAKYTFNPKMNFNIRARYYWGKVTYLQFYELQDDGTLASTDFTGNYDYNFNVFNIDAVYEWEFAPGSFINLIWKNNIFQSDDAGTDDYFDNFKKTFDSPQSNGISVKVIYYLDYLSLRKKSS